MRFPKANDPIPERCITHSDAFMRYYRLVTPSSAIARSLLMEKAHGEYLRLANGWNRLLGEAEISFRAALYAGELTPLIREIHGKLRPVFYQLDACDDWMNHRRKARGLSWEETREERAQDDVAARHGMQEPEEISPSNDLDPPSATLVDGSLAAHLLRPISEEKPTQEKRVPIWLASKQLWQRGIPQNLSGAKITVQVNKKLGYVVGEDSVLRAIGWRT